MGYKKYKATQLFDGYRLSQENKVLVTADNGRIEAIINEVDAGDDVQMMTGILSPGLINSHCHLELSHLKDVIPPYTGLPEFLCSVVTKRGFDPAMIQQRIKEAEQEMYNNGIVAVGDICNTADAVPVKSKSKIRWQSFIEVLSLSDEKADENFAHYLSVLEKHLSGISVPSRSVLTPHAPYTISPKTFRLINEATAGRLISIHNQEHPAEDELYKNGGGEYLRLFKIFGYEISPFAITGKSSLQSYLPFFNKKQKLLLVHNTCTTEEDLAFAENYAADQGIEISFCLCPNANLYIENKLPPVEMFVSHNAAIVLGTDSYSSNWHLSIVKEIQTIKKNFPQISLETILQWATINGAKMLDWQQDLGSFEKGKKPGICILSEDLESSVRIA